jgi:hypothetical protein
MKTLLITTGFILIKTLCFSQQPINNGTKESSSAVVQSNAAADETNTPVLILDNRIANEFKSHVGTRAVNPNISSINSSADLNSSKARIGERAVEAQPSEVSYTVDPAMKNIQVGRKIGK